jgi:hypothetical protein
MTFPRDNELRYAGAEIAFARLQAELDAVLARTWRGRLARRLAGWVARLRRP